MKNDNSHVAKNVSTKKARREAQKSYKKQVGLYMSLFTIFEQIVNQLTLDCMPYINTMRHEDMNNLVTDVVSDICKNCNYPFPIANCIADVTMSMLENMHLSLNGNEFVDWYDNWCSEHGTPVINGNRKHVIVARILKLKPGATEEDFKKEVRKDMLNFLPEKEVDKRFNDVYAGSRFNENKLENL